MESLSGYGGAGPGTGAGSRTGSRSRTGTAGTRAGTGRLTFVILGGMILFICMYERKERKQWPFGPWNMAAARAEDKKKE